MYWLVEKKSKGRKAGDSLHLREVKSSHPLAALEASHPQPPPGAPGRPGQRKEHLCQLPGALSGSARLRTGAGLAGSPARLARAETGLLPVMVVLRDFARSLPTKLRPEPNRTTCGISSGPPEGPEPGVRRQPLGRRSRPGRPSCCWMDWTKCRPAQRLFVRDAVRAFIERYPESRFLVTCRVLSYQPPRRTRQPDLRLADLPAFELAPFDETKIDRFVSAWYAELGRLGTCARRTWTASPPAARGRAPPGPAAPGPQPAAADRHGPGPHPQGPPAGRARPALRRNRGYPAVALGAGQAGAGGRCAAPAPAAAGSRAQRRGPEARPVGAGL